MDIRIDINNIGNSLLYNNNECVIDKIYPLDHPIVNGFIDCFPSLLTFESTLVVSQPPPPFLHLALTVLDCLFIITSATQALVTSGAMVNR